MEDHHIHGIKVGFHHETDEARRFLGHENNRHMAHEYLEQAQKHGEAHFYVDNKRYTITHEQKEGGEGAFSVSRNHSAHF